MRHRGFTLLEVLVGVAILAVMSVMAYRGVTEARVAVENAEGHLDRLREVQRAMQVVGRTSARWRAGRYASRSATDSAPRCVRDPNAITLAELSRAGWPNGAGTPRGTVQRVSYRLDERTLIRDYWTVIDPTLATSPSRAACSRGVDRVEIRYMTSGREWVTQWPDLGSAGDLGFCARPLAVEITIVLCDYGELRRVIEVPG